jgi:hypothetical protein
MMLGRILREPVLTVGLLEAVLAVAVAFGLDLTPEQTAAVLGLAAAALAFAVGARAAVTPVRTVADALGETTGAVTDLLRRARSERGGVGKGIMIGVALVFLAIAACIAVAADDDDGDEESAPAWVADRDDHDRESERGCAGADEPCESREASPSFEDSPVKDSFNFGPICVMPDSCRFS